MKTLSDITPQFIRGHYCIGTFFDDTKEISVFTFDSPKYYICTGIKKAFVVYYDFYSSAFGRKCHSKIIWTSRRRRI